MKSFRRELKLAVQAGDYRLEVLRDWRRLYAHSKLPLDYVHTVSFQRALGIPPKPRQIKKLQELKALPALHRACLGLYGYQLRQLDNLLAHQRTDLEPAVQPQYRKQIQHWRQQQTTWAGAFRQRVLQAKQIAVVGNSPDLKGKGLGKSIDQADLVIRFNHYQSEHTSAADIGKKMNTWVVAPGYNGPFPAAYDNILLSGPDMLWWQQNWAHLSQVALDEAHRQAKLASERTPVLSVPLSVWQALVAELQAPPSAGVLTLAYLRTLLTENQDSQASRLQKLKIYGFSFAQSKSSQYHHADPEHRAVARHNWSAEQIYLKRVFSPYA